MESLWIGPKDTKIEDLDEAGQQEFKKYLYDHGLDQLALANLARGTFPTRNFIPFPGQIYQGRVKKLSSVDVTTEEANWMTIEADIGQLFLLEAPRNNIYVHGHWMGKADLRYIFEDGKFEFHFVVKYFLCSAVKGELLPSI